MRTFYLLSFCILFWSCDAQTQKTVYNANEKDSKTKNISIISETTDHLELLGHIWGFLKYHHPIVAKGGFNWDFELLDILQTYTKTTGTIQRDEVLINWINSLGDVEEDKADETNPDRIKINPNINWINDYSLSQTLKDQLQFIYENRHQGRQEYIKMASYIGNPKFINESSYDSISYPDAGFNLLSLFRYWNAIEYFYPYKYLTDKDWGSVLREYIPVFLGAQSELDYELVVSRLIAEINDSHAGIVKGSDKVNEWYGKHESSALVKFIENQLVVTDFYNPDLNSSNLQIGDIILKIDSVPVNHIVSKLRPYLSASNEPVLLRKVASNILRSDKQALDLKILTSKGEKNIILPLYKRDTLKLNKWVKRVMSNQYRVLDENIGYVPAVSVKDGEVSSIKKLFKDTKGIIIDLRNYPNTTDLLYKLVPYFMSSKKQFAMFSRANTEHPGEFVLAEPLKFSRNKKHYPNKVVVLVNEYSQSLAEYMAMAYQVGHNTTILGSATAGADGDVSYIDLPGGLKTVITGIGVYYPDGRETQRVGITPDIIIRPTIQGVRNNRDELLDKAIELILK